jgi:hypothetical protein
MRHTTAATVKELKRLYRIASEIDCALVVAHAEAREHDAQRFIGELDGAIRAIYNLTQVKPGTQITRSLSKAS